MICAKCGQSMPDGSCFCPYCGERIAEPVQPDPVAETVMPESLQTETVAEPIQPEAIQEELSTEPIRLEVPLVEIIVDPVQSEEPTAAPVQERVEAGDEVEELPVPTQETEVIPERDESDCPCESQEDRPAESVSRKKKSKSMLLITIVAAVLVAAVLASCVLFFVRAASPEVRLLRAVNSSKEDLAEITSNAKTFNAMAAQMKAYEDGTSTTTSYLTNKSDEFFSESSHITVTTHRDYVNHRLLVDGELSVSTMYEDYEELNSDVKLEYQIYADTESLVLSLPNLLDDSYKIPTDRFGEKLLDSELGELITEDMDEETVELLRALDIDLATLMDPKWTELCPEEYQLFVDSIAIEKSEQTIPNAEGIEQVYVLKFDMTALRELVLATVKQFIISSIGDVFESLPEEVPEDLQESVDEAKETMESLECTVLLGVGDGKLKALYTEVKYNDETHDMTLLLAGTENVWEDILLYADGEMVLEGGFVKKKDGFNVTMEVKGEKLTVVVDDMAQEVEIKQYGKKPVTWNYDVKEDLVTLSYKLSDTETELDYSMEIRPLEEIDVPEDCVDLLSLTEEEWGELGKELVEALWTVME